jgi:VWFA-related protein
MIDSRKRFGARVCWIGLAASLLLSLLSAQVPDKTLGLPKLQPGNLPPAQPGQPAPKSQTDQKSSSDSQGSSSGEVPPAPRDPTPASPDPNAIRVTARTVLVPTTIKDKDTGSFINGLSVRDFTVYDNGKPQKISSDFSYEPLSVVVAIQSNSDVEPMIPKMRKLGILLHGLVTGEGGDVSVLSFDHRITKLVDWTSDPNKLDDGLQKLSAGSSTARTIDAVLEADRMLYRHDPQNRRRRVIVLFSQGYDKGSESKTNETLRDMQFHNVVVYCVDISQLTLLTKEPDRYPRPVMGGVPPEAMHSPTGSTNNATSVLQNHPGGNVLNVAPPIWRSIKDLFKQPPDRAFAALTGGRVYSFAKQSTLERAMTDLGKELHSQYLLSYSPDADTQKEPGFHKITVDVNHPGLEIRTRTGYYWGGGTQ